MGMLIACLICFSSKAEIAPITVDDNGAAGALISSGIGNEVINVATAT